MENGEDARNTGSDRAQRLIYIGQENEVNKHRPINKSQGHGSGRHVMNRGQWHGTGSTG